MAGIFTQRRELLAEVLRDLKTQYDAARATLAARGDKTTLLEAAILAGALAKWDSGTPGARPTLAFGSGRTTGIQRMRHYAAFKAYRAQYVALVDPARLSPVDVFTAALKAELARFTGYYEAAYRLERDVSYAGAPFLGHMRDCALRCAVLNAALWRDADHREGAHVGYAQAALDWTNDMIRTQRGHRLDQYTHTAPVTVEVPA